MFTWGTLEIFFPDLQIPASGRVTILVLIATDRHGITFNRQLFHKSLQTMTCESRPHV